MVRSDGTPLIQSIAMDNASPATYRDLSGRPQLAPEEMTNSRWCTWPASMRHPASFPRSHGGTRGSRSLLTSRSRPSTGTSCTTANPREPATSSVTSVISNRRVGFIGLNGFRSDPVPADEWIPVRGALIMDYCALELGTEMDVTRGVCQLPRVDRSDLPPRLVYVPSGNRLRKVDLAARR